jgi:hypothetical protein
MDGVAGAFVEHQHLFVIFVMCARHVATDSFTMRMVINSISCLYVTYLFPVFAHPVISFEMSSHRKI